MSQSKCQVCGKTLSSYNHGPTCYAHTEGVPVYDHVPVTRFTSREVPADPMAHCELAHAVNRAHESLGFTSGVSGVIIDGREVPLEDNFPEIR